MVATYITQNTQKIRHLYLDSFWIIFLIGIVYIGWLGSYPLFTPDEGRYSEIAREMIVRGDYITPHLNGVPFLDKPVFYYWLQVSAIKLFGLKEWALRFWPALVGVLGCLVIYLAGHLLFNRRVGILSAIILALNPLYYATAHYANLDLEVAVFITNSLLFFLLGVSAESNKKRFIFLMLAYIFTALAVLTKGLIGIVFPIMIMGTWILILNRWKIPGKMHLLLGLSIFILIVAPWYVRVQQANPEFLHFFFVTQQFSRFVSKAGFNNQTPLLFYVPVILIGFLPWTLYLFQALFYHFKTVWKDRQNNAIQLFILLWFILVFLFFSIPKSKTIGYILPTFPPLALMVGNYLNVIWDSREKIKFSCSKKIFSWLMAIAVLLVVILHFSAPIINDKSIKSIALQAKSVIKPGDEVVTYFHYYQDLPIYLERKITIVADWHAADIATTDNWRRELWYGMPFKDTSSWLIEAPTFWQKWNSDQRVFVFVSKNFFRGFKAKTTGPIYKLAENKNILLISNHL